MKLRASRWPLAALLSIAASPAIAQGDPVEPDLRCLVVGFALAGSDQDAHKSAAIPFSLYYLGRLDGRAPQLDLEKRLGDLATTMTGDDIKTEAARCGADFQRRGIELQAIGKALQDRAKAAERTARALLDSAMAAA